MPSTEGVPSSFSLSHIISGSVPARRWRPVSSSNSACIRCRFPRQSEERNAPAVLALLAVAEADAPDARDARVPRKRLERLRLGHADELGGLRPVSDVVAVAVGEEVRGGAVDELESLLRDRLPVLRRDALAHDPAGDGEELVVDVLMPSASIRRRTSLTARHVRRPRRSAPGRSPPCPPFLASQVDRGERNAGADRAQQG